MKKFFTVLALVVSLNGCTTYGYLQAVPLGTQKAGYADGNPSVTSQMMNIVQVVVPSTFTVGERMRIFVQTGNAGIEDYGFDTSYVTALNSDDLDVWSDLHVYSYDELVAEEKRRQMWAAIAVALSGVSRSMAASNAGYSYNDGTYSGAYNGNYNGNIYSGYGSASYGGTYGGTYGGSWSSVTYNPYIAQMAQENAQAQTNAEMQSLMESGNRAMAALGRSILKYNTVSPGSYCGGQVEIDSPKVFSNKVTNLKIVIKAGSEQHTFLFNVGKAHD